MSEKRLPIITEEERKQLLEIELKSSGDDKIISPELDLPECLSELEQKLEVAIPKTKKISEVANISFSTIDIKLFEYFTHLLLTNHYYFNLLAHSQFTEDEILLKKVILFKPEFSFNLSGFNSGLNRPIIDFNSKLSYPEILVTKKADFKNLLSDSTDLKSKLNNLVLGLSNSSSLIYSDLLPNQIVYNHGNGDVKAIFDSFNSTESVEVVHKIFNDKLSVLISGFDKIISEIKTDSALWSILYTNTPNSKSVVDKALSNLQRFSNLLQTSYETLVTELENIDSNVIKLKSEIILRQITYCGKKLDLNSDVNTESKDDTNFRGFEDNTNNQITKIGYWIRFSKILNIVGLKPDNYTVGLILPTTPPTRVFLPIVWIPQAVIPTSTGITVIFLTINGVIFSPVIWKLNFPPVANAKSVFTSLFRGTGVTIKEDTGSKVLNPPVVDGIDTDPELTKDLPFEIDDIPVSQRLTIDNFQFLRYLDQWIKTAKPYMGFP